MKNGRVLVWAGEESAAPLTPRHLPQPSQSPASYTPPHLAERIRAEQAALEARGGTDGERKTITALFADLKGSTALDRRARSRRSAGDYRSRFATDDGRRASL